MNEGHLGKFSFGGERAATDNHPAVIQYLPLDASVKTALQPGTLMKSADGFAATAAKGESNKGVTAATVDAKKFAAKVGNKPGTYVFTYQTEAWKLSGADATLDDYGVTPTGEPQDNDTITVTLSVNAVSYLPVAAVEDVPCAVVDLPCDPSGEKGESSAACVVHGTVKTRLLQTGEGKAPTAGQISALAEHGVFAV